MERLRVGVIFGGRSVEHDVSIVTAHQVMAVLAEDHDVVPIYVTREGRWFSDPALNDLAVYRDRRWESVGAEVTLSATTGAGMMTTGGRLRGGRSIPLDVVVPAIHGTYGEDGTLQGLLELAGLPYVGSGVVGSAVGMDKPAMKAAFRAAGLPVVPDELIDAGDLDRDRASVIGRLEDAIGYPCFVKPARLGSSVGISRADDRAGLEDALAVATRYDQRVLIEPAMDGCKEINCSVLGGPGRDVRVSVCEEPVAWETFLSFSDKYLRSEKTKGPSEGMVSQSRRIPAPISEELTKQVQENAVTAFKAVDAGGVARVDSFVKEETGETWVMEINTVPGSFSFYLWEASGLPFRELMDDLLAIALETHRLKSELMYTFESGMLERGPGAKTDG